ncbi:type I-E CRISPR-associated protein Cse2/CasB [Levilactobacillus zymae]|uniref:type I-E CRISPR-associated protein Cse2/CasB n=1 Tax=Levilactobacillus zymae TaxID=267363 RepID=UPI003FCD8428
MPKTVRTITQGLIRTLYNEGNLNRAVLANLRGSTKITDTRAQAIWPLMLSRLEDNMLSYTGQPTKQEIAIYSALHFYALCQQGNDYLVYGPAPEKNSTKKGSDSNQLKEGMPLFKALAALRANEDNRDGLDRRVQNLLALTEISGTVNGLSHLLGILKARSESELKVDFGQIAQDLYDAQRNYQRFAQIRLLWGQQYFWGNYLESQSEGKEN